VETNLGFVAGSAEVVVPAREQASYSFKVLAMHEGEYSGEILFKNEKCCMVYPLQVRVRRTRTVQTIRVASRVRATSSVSLELANKSAKPITYEVCCEGDCMEFPSQF
jgi:hypothetical protein